MKHSAPRRARTSRGYAALAVATVASAILVLEGSPVAWAAPADSAGVAISTAQRAAAAGAMALPVTTAALALPARQSAASAAAKALAVKPKAKPVVVKKKKAAVAPYRFGTKKFNLWYAQTYMLAKYHWAFPQFACLARMWGKESAWNQNAWNHASGARGIPQAQPGNKMSKFGKDWRTNPTVQIRWGLAYIRGTYGSPCSAWAFWQRHHWY
ncbi:MAG TPA: hypothetical protein VGN19_14420 [Pedococcus sp.]|jgi:hypothetical protein|nr:hypothetical protein [Pedococcus sp.]